MNTNLYSSQSPLQGTDTSTILHTTAYTKVLTDMQNTYTQHSGCAPDDAGDIGIRLKVLAGEIARLYGAMEALDQELFPQTSTLEYLDRHAALRGIQRKAAICAAGQVTFRRELPAPNDIPIPARTMIGSDTNPQILYLTMTDTTLPQGGTTVTVPATALDAGSTGNMATGKVSLLMSSLPMISHVSNDTPFTGGVEEESDSTLRKRLLHSYQYISNGTNAAYYHDIVMNQPGVRSVHVLPRKRGRGSVDIVFRCDNPTEAPTVRHEMERLFLSEKEINVDVMLYPATERRLSFAVAITSQDDYNYEQVAGYCREKMTSYLAQTDIGQPLLLAQLGKELLTIDGLTNYRFQTPADDVYLLDNEIIVPSSVLVERLVK